MLALAVVASTGVFLLALGVASLVAPARAGGFLLGFAGSPGKHYAELALRLVVGAAFLVAAPRLPWPMLFTIFGAVLLVTTGVLLLLPWRWHHRFASTAVPRALPWLSWIGVSSLLLGGVVSWAAWRGLSA